MLKKPKWILAVALFVVAFAGIAYASSRATKGYICPVTGEELPCPECCPYCK
jgi:hypothetical protein